jgi:RNA polymerase sigma-70 factor, ECF subfamily
LEKAVTQLPDAPGEPDLDRLVPLLYQELHEIAHRILGREIGDPTLSTTTLLHEAYLKLSPADTVTARGRAYLFAAASRAMRQVLVEHARRRGRAKRGGGAVHVRLEEARLKADAPCPDVLDVDRALTRLAEIRPRAARIVEGRFFGGLELGELAQILDVSERTAKRDWAFARAWLFRELSGDVRTV